MHYVRDFFVFTLRFSLFKSERMYARRFAAWQINKQSIKSPKLFQPSLRCVGLIVDRVKRSFISLYSKKTMMDFDKISRMDRLFFSCSDTGSLLVHFD